MKNTESLPSTLTYCKYERCTLALHCGLFSCTHSPYFCQQCKVFPLGIHGCLTRLASLFHKKSITSMARKTFACDVGKEQRAFFFISGVSLHESRSTYTVHTFDSAAWFKEALLCADTAIFKSTYSIVVRKIYCVIFPIRAIIIETRPSDDTTAPSIFISWF